MNRRIFWIALAAVLIIGAGIAIYAFTTINDLLTFEPIDFVYSTTETDFPANPSCLGGEGASPTIAKEIINLETGGIYVAGGENEMPDEVWLEHNFRLPILQNSTRNLLFDETCFFRSPNADPQCASEEECFTIEEIDGYSWYLLTYNLGQECFPDAAGCSGDTVEPGHVSITTIDKCQQVVFNGPEIYVLSDDAGNRFVMHATATSTPDLSAELPEGYTLEVVQIDEPLVLLPFGDNEACYFNILRDNLVQAYHQFEYATDQYPPQAQ